MYKIEANGVVERVGEREAVAKRDGGTSTKRELVIVEPEGKFPATLIVEFWNTKAEKLDSFGRGDLVKVTASVKSMRKEGWRYASHFVTGESVERVSAARGVEERKPEPEPMPGDWADVPF